MNQVQNQVEKHFQVHSLYKRSRQYLDIQKMNEQEHLEEIYRRIPTKAIDTLDTRLDSSFQNSIEAVNDKLNRDVSIARRRYHNNQSLSIDEYEDYLDTSVGEIESSRYKDEKQKKKVRVSDWNKMLPRLSQWEKKSPYKNEDQFNNFSVTVRHSNSPKNSLLDFELATTREYRNKSKSPRSYYRQNPQTDIVKAVETKQKNTFNQSVYRCLFDYSRTDSKKNLKAKKPETKDNPPFLASDRIHKSVQQAKVSHSPNLHEFYHTISKQVPGQMHMKNNNQISFYFGNKDDRNKKEEFDAKKRREEMMQKKKKQLASKKQPSVLRQEMCDQKYFLLMKNRMKRNL